MHLPNLEGQVIDQYELQEFVGRGGMGVVYRARQQKLKRDVAIKILSAARASDPEKVKRFSREAETSAMLEHPHIVPIYDYGTENGMNYVVMRLLTGGSLSERMREIRKNQAPRLGLEEIAELLYYLAIALDYAHFKGVIHRDIKPSNIMFDDFGNVYLVDFGLVKLLDSSQSALTHSGVLLGTPTYMAPEQWLELELTPAIDQYALAVIVYALVTGELPFFSEKPYDLMQLHCHKAPTPAHHIEPSVPDAVSDVLNKALAKNAHDRFESMHDFTNAFRDAIIRDYGHSQSIVGSTDIPSQMMTYLGESNETPHAKPIGVLIVEESRDQAMIGQRVEVTQSPFQIGRLSRDLNFDDDRNVSRNHASITMNDNGEFFIEDQGSTLRTTVSSIEIQPYSPVKLSHEDRICLGTTTFVTFLIEYM